MTKIISFSSCTHILFVCVYETKSFIKFELLKMWILLFYFHRDGQLEQQICFLSLKGEKEFISWHQLVIFSKNFQPLFNQDNALKFRFLVFACNLPNHTYLKTSKNVHFFMFHFLDLQYCTKLGGMFCIMPQNPSIFL